MEYRYITCYRGRAHVLTVDARGEEEAWDAVMACAEPKAPGLLLTEDEWEQLVKRIRRGTIKA